MLARLALSYIRAMYERFVRAFTIDEERGAESMLWAESWWFPETSQEETE